MYFADLLINAADLFNSLTSKFRKGIKGRQKILFDYHLIGGGGVFLSFFLSDQNLNHNNIFFCRRQFFKYFTLKTAQNQRIC